MTSPLPDRELYRRQGYAVVPGLIEAPERALYLERLQDIVDGRVEPAERMLVMRDVMVAKGAVAPGTRLEAIAKLQDYEQDPVLDGYATHPRILDGVEALLGPGIQSIHTMLINKPPHVDGRHPLHQDLLYFPFRPADRIVGVWTALERVTRENGCLVVVPESHNLELLPHGNPDWEYVNLAYFGAEGVGAHPERRHLEMEPGDTVFFHPLLLHGSGRNRTEGFRRAISAHYASLDCETLWEAERFGTRNYRVVRPASDSAG
ncbi:MAG: phytanoyl-CoA dioxygenase family protein [Proteobacteria bacterium]|nr:phytanoyl-CoA dioxygenase family protein [Pseudomonadota bacterium]